MSRSFRAVTRTGRLAVLIAVALLAAACGGDGDGGGGSSAAGGDCGNTLKVGALVPLTGELGSFGEDWLNGIQLAVDQINESGALPEGWEAELVSGDEKADQEEGLRAARKMVDSDKVSVIVGPTSSSIVGMVDLAADSETPIISPAAGTISLDELGGEWVYRTVSSDATQGVAVVKWFQDQGVEQIGMAVQNDEATISPANVLKQRFTDGGGEVVGEVTYNPGQPSYQAELESVLGGDPPVIFLAGGGESGVTILDETFNSGFDGKFLITSEMTTQDVIDGVGAERMEGVQGMTPQADTSTPTYQAFDEAYQAAFDDEPELFTANAYDAVMMSALAAITAGGTCGADVNSELVNVSRDGDEYTDFAEAAAAAAEGADVDWRGASGPVDFDESGSVADSYAILEVQGGEWAEIEFYSQEEIQAELES